VPAKVLGVPEVQAAPRTALAANRVLGLSVWEDPAETDENDSNAEGDIGAVRYAQAAAELNPSPASVCAQAAEENRTNDLAKEQQRFQRRRRVQAEAVRAILHQEPVLLHSAEVAGNQRRAADL